MSYILTEEQTMLKQSAKEFFSENAPVEALRKLRDERDERGFSLDLWQMMAEMGFTSLIIPEEFGGMAFGFVGLGQALEEMGRTLTASPMLSTGVVSTTLLNLAGSAEQKSTYLPKIAEGSIVMTLAVDETAHHNPKNIKLAATTSNGGYLLNGKKTFVLDGHVADILIVAAKTEKGVDLFLVDAKADGVSVERTIMMDSRNYAKVSFDNVKVDASARLGKPNTGAFNLQVGLAVANACLAAEMLGTMQEAYERTVEYIKNRTQFGVRIGSFQALQHRAAHLYCEIELCKTLVSKALQAIDKKSMKLPYYASLAKAKCCEVIKTVSNEAIQMHGGIGMTDDEEIGFFLKRARVAQQTFGGYNYHIDAVASMAGY